MTLDKSELQKIAWLARLAIDEQDIPHYSTNLSNILGLIEQMNTVDTSNILPVAHPLDLYAWLRPDNITETDQREHFQKIAPSTGKGFYLLPKVIE